MPKRKYNALYMGVAPTTSLPADHIYLEGSESVQDALTKKCILLDTITLTEDVANVEFVPTTSLKKCIIEITSAVAASSYSIAVYVNDIVNYVLIFADAFDTSVKYTTCMLETDGLLNAIGVSSNANSSNAANVISTHYAWQQAIDNITKVTINTSSADLLLTDTVIKIYGIEA